MSTNTIKYDEKYTPTLSIDNKKYSGLIYHPILLNPTAYNVIVNQSLYDKQHEDDITHFMFSGAGCKNKIAPVCHFTESMKPSSENMIDNSIVYSFEISYQKLNKNDSIMLNIYKIYIEEHNNEKIKYIVINDIKINPITLDRIQGRDSCITMIPLNGISSCYRFNNLNNIMKVNVIMQPVSKVFDRNLNKPKLIIDYYQSAFRCEHMLIKTRTYPYISRISRAYPMNKVDINTYRFSICSDILKTNKLVSGFVYNATVVLDSEYDNDNDNLKEISAYIVQNNENDKVINNVLQTITGIHALMNYNQSDTDYIKILKNRNKYGYTMNFSIESSIYNTFENYIRPGAINLNVLENDIYEIYIDAIFSEDILSTPIIVLQIEAEAKFFI